jgi:hypothetical protein
MTPADELEAAERERLKIQNARDRSSPLLPDTSPAANAVRQFYVRWRFDLFFLTEGT